MSAFGTVATSRNNRRSAADEGKADNICSQ
jgi:hypothetical protein